MFRIYKLVIQINVELCQIFYYLPSEHREKLQNFGAFFNLDRKYLARMTFQ